MNNRLSIITINYNDAKGLEKTIASVINQTHLDFEYIVIDGNSNDGSQEVIKKNESHIDYWISEKDSGIYNAMNKGIKAATGEYLLFLNSGDQLYNKEVIEKNIVHLKNYDLISFDMEIVSESGSKIETYPSVIRFSDLFFSYLPHSSTFIKKQLFDTVGLYDETLKIVSDWKFMIVALFVHHCSYCKINGTVSTFYEGGISSQINNSTERNQVLKEYFSDFYQDYKSLEQQKKILTTNRYKLLSEVEKMPFNRKIISFILRFQVVLFSKKRIKEVLKK